MTQKHIHKLKKHTYKTGNSVFFCTLPDCHYKIDAALTVGKITLCNLCGKEFRLNEYDIRRVRPHCSDCVKVKIAGPDGKSHYVRKTTTPVMAAVAAEHSNDLRSRLDDALGHDDEKDI